VKRLERVDRLDGALGDYQRHRLPGVGDDLLRQDFRAGRRDQARVRDEQGQPPQRGRVGRQENVDDAGPASRFARFDTDDSGVSVRAPMDSDVQHSRQADVSDVPALTSDQSRILAAAYSRTEQAFGHGVSQPRRAASAARGRFQESAVIALGCMAAILSLPMPAGAVSWVMPA
jgi:hypothetical protein